MFVIDNGWRRFRHVDSALGTVGAFTCCKDDGLSSLALSILTCGCLLALEIVRVIERREAYVCEEVVCLEISIDMSVTGGRRLNVIMILRRSS